MMNDFKSLWLTGAKLETIFYDDKGNIIATVHHLDLPAIPLPNYYHTEDADFEVVQPKLIENGLH